jgi:hypothetical protein
LLLVIENGCLERTVPPFATESHKKVKSFGKPTWAKRSCLVTTRCVADFLCGKNQCVRFLISIAVPEVSYDRAARNKVPCSLYLQRSFSEIFVDGRGCGKRLVGGAIRNGLEGMGIAVFNDFSTGKDKKSAESGEC